MKNCHLRILTVVVIFLALSKPLTMDAQKAAVGSRKKPNVIFILIDDMGYGDIGAYGVTDIRTPHLDQLARQGVKLTDAYVAPVCTPTRAAFVTGRYQQRVGLEWATTADQKEAGLPASETSIARMLKGNGYKTALFGKWHLGVKPEFGPNAHGFDEYFGILGGNADMYSHKNRVGEQVLYENTQPVEREGYLTDLLTERAVSYVERHPRDPFFMYVAYNAVHWPFQPPDKPSDVRTSETWMNGTREDYARMLERVDDGVGKILAALDRQGLAGDTLVIFTDDNGGERLSRNAPLSHGKGTLWEGGIRVPCLLRWPGKLPAGRTSDQAAIMMDFSATILAATGTKPPANRPLDGIDILPILAGRKPVIERTFFWRIDHEKTKQKAVRKGTWKYLQNNGVDLLFELKGDIGERVDVSRKHPQLVAQMRRLYAQWEQDVDRVRPAFIVK